MKQLFELVYTTTLITESTDFQRVPGNEEWSYVILLYCIILAIDEIEWF